MDDLLSTVDSIIAAGEWVAILDRLHIGAFTFTRGRRITSFNHTLASLMGIPAEEAIGRDCREIFGNAPCRVFCPALDDHNPQEDRNPPQDQNTVEWQPITEVTNSENETLSVARLTTPIYDRARRLVGCLTIIQDQPPLADLIKRINYDDRSLKNILNSLDIGIFTVNRGGYITFFNTAAEKISGYDRKQILGQAGIEILGIRGVRRLREVILNGHAGASEMIKITTPEGDNVPVKADFHPLINETNKTIGGLITLKDLTLSQQFDQVVHDRYTFHNMIGKDPGMQKIFEMVRVVAASKATVLIEGATGTGKDLLVRVIHSAGKRSEKPLVKVNCAALPDNLLESEMFGYVKGAFTGADRDKPGRFQEADGGTIFLDEIGDLPLSLQAKLLRVFDDHEFYQLGSRHTTKVDVRIIAATNRNLEKLVAKHLFREDLFYRLNVLRMELPALKDRRPDLPLLIRHIMRRLCAARDKSPMSISEEAMEILLSYDYPGNIRELENILEHAVIICREDMIRSRHLHGYLQRRMTNRKNRRPERVEVAGDESFDLGRERILGMLQKYNWHREKTARALGMDRTTLWRKMKRYGINP